METSGEESLDKDTGLGVMETVPNQSQEGEQNTKNFQVVQSQEADDPMKSKEGETKFLDADSEADEGAEIITVHFEASREQSPERTEHQVQPEGDHEQQDQETGPLTLGAENLDVRYPHVSIVQTVQDVKWEQNNDDRGIQCPLCESDKTWDGTSRIQRHIKHCHWNHQVPTKIGWMILLCRKSCHRESHFHCPSCGCLKIRGTLMRTHLEQCTGENKPPEVHPEEFFMGVDLKKDPDEAAGPCPERRTLDILKEQLGTYYHFTMVSQLSDVRVCLCRRTQCCHGKKYHCPMCPPTVYKPNNLNKVQKHILTNHWKYRVDYQDMTILKCMSLCADSVNGRPLGSHWHCPHCSRTLNSRKAMTYHLRSHSRGTNYRQRTNDDWAALLGREAAGLLWQDESSGSDHDEGDGRDMMDKAELLTPADSELDQIGEAVGTDRSSSSGRPKEVFQTVAALMTQDMLSLIPGSVSVFLSELQEKSSIQYTLAEDWCLIQGKWQTLMHIHSVLDRIRGSSPANDEVPSHCEQQQSGHEEHLSPFIKEEANDPDDQDTVQDMHWEADVNQSSSSTTQGDQLQDQTEVANQPTSECLSSPVQIDPAEIATSKNSVNIERDNMDGKEEDAKREVISDQLPGQAPVSRSAQGRISILKCKKEKLESYKYPDISIQRPSKEKLPLLSNTNITKKSNLPPSGETDLGKIVPVVTPKVICKDPRKMGLRSGRTIKLRDQIKKGDVIAKSNLAEHSSSKVKGSPSKTVQRTLDWDERASSKEPKVMTEKDELRDSQKELTQDSQPAEEHGNITNTTHSKETPQNLCDTKTDKQSNIIAESCTATKVAATQNPSQDSPVKRGRGRPPKKAKNLLNIADSKTIEKAQVVIQNSNTPGDTPVKRGRGRPPKQRSSHTDLSSPKCVGASREEPKQVGDSEIPIPQRGSSFEATGKRKRGRPRKSVPHTPDITFPLGRTTALNGSKQSIIEGSSLNTSSPEINTLGTTKKENTKLKGQPALLNEQSEGFNDDDQKNDGTANLDRDEEIPPSKRKKVDSDGVCVEVAVNTKDTSISLLVPERAKEDLADHDTPASTDMTIPVGKNTISLLSKPVKGLSLARVTKVEVCPACGRGFKDSNRYHQHLLGTNCLEKARKRQQNFQVPPELATWLSEVQRAVTEPQCPNCNKTFSHILHARMHYSNKTCTDGAKKKHQDLPVDPDTGHFKCRKCDFSAISANRVIDHESRKHWEKNEICPLCNKRYSSKALLKQHIKTIHAMGNEKAVCDQCGAAVPAHLFKHHLKVKHDPTYVKPKNIRPNRLVTCRECDFSTNKPGQMSRHYARVHKTADKKCPHCESMFYLQSDLTKHVKFIHEGAQLPSAPCPQCGKTLFKKNMAAHIKMVHEGRRPHACPVCGRAFLTRFTLQQHTETHKPSEERDTKFLCAFCGKGFQNRTHYTDHLNIHTGARPYICNICNKTFRCNPALFKHKELHRKVDLHCTICDINLPTRKELRMHMNRMHDTTTGAVFKCVCSAEFDMQPSLQQHQSTCGQWQQLHPLQADQVTDQDQMAMIIQSGANKPGTYLVIEGREGEETVMVLQTLNDMEESDIVRAISGGSEVMAMTSSEILTISETENLNAISVEPAAETFEDPEDVVSAVIEQHAAEQAAVNESDIKHGDLNRYLCGYCQQLFTGLEDVQAHMMAVHVASEGGEVELALHSTGQADLDIDAIHSAELSENIANQTELTLNVTSPTELALHIPGQGELCLVQNDAAI